jgi:hypothetical protein
VQGVLVAARGEQRCLVHQVAQIRCDQAGSRGGNVGEVHIGASGTPRVCTPRIAWRPASAGGCTTTRGSNRLGRSSGVSSTLGLLFAASTRVRAPPEIQSRGGGRGS